MDFLWTRDRCAWSDPIILLMFIKWRQVSMFTAKHFWHYCHPSHPAKIWAIVETKPHNLPDPSPYSQQPQHFPKQPPPLTWPTHPNNPYLGTWYSKPSLKSDSRRDVVLWYETEPVSFSGLLSKDIPWADFYPSCCSSVRLVSPPNHSRIHYSLSISVLRNSL